MSILRARELKLKENLGKKIENKVEITLTLWSFFVKIVILNEMPLHKCFGSRMKVINKHY